MLLKINFANKENIKSFLAQKSTVLYTLFKRIYSTIPLSVRSKLEPNNIPLFIEAKITSHLRKNFYFIKIGANDGITREPLAPWIQKYKWSGIFVEPLEEIFEQLKNNYKDYDNLIFENSAISDIDGVKIFYYLDDSDLPDWSKELGSFDINVILKHSRFGIPNIEKYIKQKEVKCLKFSTLLEKYQVTRIDFLAIDVEGHDYEIIKQIDFLKFKPSMILYEHSNLSLNEAESCQQFLLTQGYKLVKYRRDTFAYQAQS